MTAEIHSFIPGIVGDGFKTDPDEALTACVGKFTAVVIVGIDRDGKLRGNSSEGRPEAITMLERAKQMLLKSYDDSAE